MVILIINSINGISLKMLIFLDYWGVDFSINLILGFFIWVKIFCGYKGKSLKYIFYICFD